MPPFNTIAHETLGPCICGDTVILVHYGFTGFRYCLGCEATGPDVTLESEVRVVEIDAAAEFEADDFTEVNATPWALLEAARRG